MTRIDVIQDLINSKGYKRYLEIGIQDGVCFDQIECEVKVGVDPFPRVIVDYQMTSDAFFSQNKEFYDIIFIDGLHTKEQALKDFYNTLECLSEGGVIVFHDTNPDNKEYTSQLWCGDVYRAIVHLWSVGFELYTHPDDHGVTVVTGVKELNKPHKFEDSYVWFDLNRDKVLNFV